MKIVGLIFLLVANPACATDTNDLTPRLRELEENLGQMEARLSRQMNELLWWKRLGDIATIDKVRFGSSADVNRTPQRVRSTAKSKFCLAVSNPATDLPREIPRHDCAESATQCEHRKRRRSLRSFRQRIVLHKQQQRKDYDAERRTKNCRRNADAAGTGDP